jgi:glutathione synthase/RimK-type ligase-like ATP-grasp enzyme
MRSFEEHPVRLLLTGSRAPVTLDLIRLLVQAGHEVHAADTFAPTLGSHSRGLRCHHILPPPRHAPEAFSQELHAILKRERIDWLLPTCEEVFHVGRHLARLSEVTHVFCPPLEELQCWHDKGAFQQFAASRGLLTPRTSLVRNVQELHAVLPQFPAYLLKPAFSRFAGRIVTNSGPRAGQTPLSACRPSAADPWLVQEYIEGVAECSYSVVHHGRITAHCAYRTPHQLAGGAGVSFRSIPGGPTLAIAQTLLPGTGFTGQFSLDFLRTSQGQRVLLECNPRATSAVHVMTPARLAHALLHSDAPLWVEPPGHYQQLLPAVLAQPLALWRTPMQRWCDVILRARDPLPAVMQFVQIGHFLSVARRKQISLLAAMTDDIEWNGPDRP